VSADLDASCSALPVSIGESERLLVNKTELIEHIANNADISKAAAARALESTIEAVKKTLKKGGTVSLVGFGTSQLASVQLARVAIPAPALRLKSKLLKFQSSVQARH
jgi:threonine dehydrogenase-like Zn-dependent dehydrogenase